MCGHAARLDAIRTKPHRLRYCSRQPTFNPRPFPATANYPAAECTRLLCGVALPLQTTLPVGWTRPAAYADMFPLVSDYIHICFLPDLLLQLLLKLLLLSRSAHGQLKIPLPLRTARVPTIYSHRGASAAPALPSVRRENTLPACRYAFTIGKFRR